MSPTLLAERETAFHHEVSHEGTARTATAERFVRLEGNVDTIAALTEGFAQLIGDDVEPLTLDIARR